MYFESGCLSFPCLEEEEEEDDDSLSDVSKSAREIVLMVTFGFVVETNKWEKTGANFKHFKAVSPNHYIHMYILLYVRTYVCTPFLSLTQMVFWGYFILNTYVHMFCFSFSTLIISCAEKGDLCSIYYYYYA